MAQSRYYQGMTPQRLSQSASVAGIPGPEIISMYNPEGMQQLIDATGQRQQRFDVVTQGLAAERARIGELETYDKDALTNRLTEFETNINKLVQDKYNGDYSAAANEIAMKVASERAHPFYAFNKQKVAAVNTYLEDMRRIGPGFVATNDPRDVSYDAWKQGANLGYTPIDLTKVTQTSASLFQPIAKSIRSEGKWRSILGGQYFEKTDQYGLRDEKELAEFLDNTPEGQAIVEEIYKLQPELAQVKNQDAVFSAIFAGGKHAIGTPETKTLANQGYGAESDSTQAPMNLITKSEETPEKLGWSNFLTSPQWRDARNRLSQSVASELGIPNVTNFEDLLKLQSGNKVAKVMTAAIASMGTPGAGNVLGGIVFSSKKFNERFNDAIKLLGDTNIDENLKKAVRKAMEKEFIGPGLEYDMYHINRTAVSYLQNQKAATAIQNDIKNLDTWAQEYIKRESFKPTTKESKKNLEAIKGDTRIMGFNFFNTNDEIKLFLDVIGEDKDGKSYTVAVETGDYKVIEEFLPIMSYLSNGEAARRLFEDVLPELNKTNPAAAKRFLGVE